jgi:hypothetical protein
MIYCLGDSHRDIFFYINSYMKKNIFQVYNIQHTLAYNIAYEDHHSHSLILNVLKNLSVNSKILMIFGEIDCRCHIVKQSLKQKKSLDYITEQVVDNYCIGLKRLIDKKYNINVWGPVASMNDVNVLNTDKHPLYPYVGNNLERNYVTKKFNVYLKEKCEKLNIGFYSVLENLINNDGSTKDEYYVDHVHLGFKAVPLILNNLQKLLEDENDI